MTEPILHLAHGLRWDLRVENGKAKTENLKHVPQGYPYEVPKQER